MVVIGTGRDGRAARRKILYKLPFTDALIFGPGAYVSGHAAHKMPHYISRGPLASPCRHFASVFRRFRGDIDISPPAFLDFSLRRRFAFSALIATYFWRTYAHGIKSSEKKRAVLSAKMPSPRSILGSWARRR